jgi:hypothetical protein
MMIFEIWVDDAKREKSRDGSMFILTSRCIARRTKGQVKLEYHDMEPGEIRLFTKTGSAFIIRTK